MQSLSRRHFLGQLLAASAAMAAEAPQQRLPNIVLILADDLGFGDVGYNNPEVRTPNIDAMAARGIRLTQLRCAPVCSPTRAGLLTGRSPLRVGMDLPLPAGTALPATERLLPELLRDQAGYQTALIGKWHLGDFAPQYRPNARGFDHFYGYLGGEVDYFTHRRNNRLDWQRNGVGVEEEGYTTDLLAAEAVRYITTLRDKERPFFLQLSFNAPHTPLAAKEADLARWEHIPNLNRRTFLAMVESMDEAFGRVMEALQAANILDDTLLVWISDNGGNPRLGGAFNGGLRGAKGQAFDGGIRVPGFLHWPQGVEGGWECDNLISCMDLFPTLLAAAGITPDPRIRLDGYDLWRLFREGSGVDRDPLIIGQAGSVAVFQGDWKLVEHTAPATGETQVLLFRIWEDPLEQNDVAAGHPAVVEELVELLGAHPRGRLDSAEEN